MAGCHRTILAVACLALAGPARGAETPAEVLEGKGLKKEGRVYVLADEADVLSRYQQALPKFREFHDAADRLAEVEELAYSLSVAELMQANIRVGNAEINNMIDSLPRTRVIRKNNLNSSQTWMQTQLYENRQNKAILGREINQMRKQLRSLGDQKKLLKEYERLEGDCSEELRSLEAQVTAVLSRYREVTSDTRVKAAAAELQRSTKVPVKFGPSEALVELKARIKQEKQSMRSGQATKAPNTRRR